MSLTYQPFAVLPVVKELSKELRHNVGGGERFGSALAGASMLASAWTAKGLGKLGLMASGGALLYRALTGHCALYHYLGKDTRHHTSSSVRE